MQAKPPGGGAVSPPVALTFKLTSAVNVIMSPTFRQFSRFEIAINVPINFCSTFTHTHTPR